MRKNPVTWPFLAFITRDSEPLAEWKCSTAGSLLSVLHPFRPVGNSPRHVPGADQPEQETRS